MGSFEGIQGSLDDIEGCFDKIQVWLDGTKRSSEGI